MKIIALSILAFVLIVISATGMFNDSTGWGYWLALAGCVLAAICNEQDRW